MYLYAEVGYRYLCFQMPGHYFVVDDYGSAVEVDTFNDAFDGCEAILAPDYDNPPSEEGESYKYTLFVPNIH